MRVQTYPATRYLRRLTPANGWRGQLVRDHRGRPVAIVAVRIGPTWTDAVAIEGEDRCVAMRRCPRRAARAVRAADVTALHTDTRGRLRWRLTVACDAGVTLHTRRADLPTGLVIERVDGADAPLVFVTDLAGSEVTLTTEQAADWPPR